MGTNDVFGQDEDKEKSEVLKQIIDVILFSEERELIGILQIITEN